MPMDASYLRRSVSYLLSLDVKPIFATTRTTTAAMKLFDFVADLKSHKLLGNINIVPYKSPARIRFEHEEITAILRIEDVNRSDFCRSAFCERSMTDNISL